MADIYTVLSQTAELPDFKSWAKLIDAAGYSALLKIDPELGLRFFRTVLVPTQSDYQSTVYKQEDFLKLKFIARIFNSYLIDRDKFQKIMSYHILLLTTRMTDLFTLDTLKSNQGEDIKIERRGSAEVLEDIKQNRIDYRNSPEAMKQIEIKLQNAVSEVWLRIDRLTGEGKQADNGVIYPIIGLLIPEKLFGDTESTNQFLKHCLEDEILITKPNQLERLFEYVFGEKPKYQVVLKKFLSRTRLFSLPDESLGEQIEVYVKRFSNGAVSIYRPHPFHEVDIDRFSSDLLTSLAGSRNCQVNFIDYNKERDNIDCATSWGKMQNPTYVEDEVRYALRQMASAFGKDPTEIDRLFYNH